MSDVPAFPEGRFTDASETRAVAAIRRAMRFRVVLVQASAGYGKTTAIRAAVGLRSYIWVDLASAPREPGALLYGIAHALDIKTASLGRVLADARELNSTGPIIDWLDSHNPALSLVIIDDVHLLADDRLSLDVLAALVTRAPHVSWILAARHDVRLPISTWMAYGIMTLPITETELALSSQEMSALLRGSMRTDEAMVRALTEMSGGWPVIAQFFRQAAARTTDLSLALTTSKEIAFTYLAEHVVGTMDPGRLDFVRLLAFAGSCTRESLEALGREAPFADLVWLRSAGVPVVSTEPTIRLHELFSEYVRRSTPTSERLDIVVRLIAHARARGRIGEAVDLARAYAPQLLGELLSRDGFRLLDEGRWETAEAVVQALPIELKRDDAGILGLRAAMAAFAGAFDTAIGLYKRAIERADDVDLLSLLSRRLGLVHLNLASGDPERILAPVLDVGSERNQCEARSVYAIALAMAGNAAAARDVLQAALRTAHLLGDRALIARVMMRLAWAYFHLGEPQASDDCATRSAHMAEAIGDWETYAAANSMLCSVAGFFRDDTGAELWYAQQMVLGATRAGDRQRRSFGLWAQYGLEVDRGRRDRVESLERELETDAFAYRDGFIARFAQAIRLGWDGLFLEGVQKLDALDGQIFNAAEHRCWRATLALFQAIAGREEAARKTLARVGHRPTQPPMAADRVYLVMGDLYAALTDVFLDRTHTALRRLPTDATRKQDIALGRAIRLLALAPSVTPDGASEALDELRAADRGGLADLIIEAIRRRPDDLPARLSAAEVAILRELDAGRTAKLIAETTGRSYEGVRMLIKRAARKLSASGQIEAVAIARRLGLLHNPLE